MEIPAAETEWAPWSPGLARCLMTRAAINIVYIFIYKNTFKFQFYFISHL